jgi:peptidoglycan/LPS O-acetylase OafA/YrhL
MMSAPLEQPAVATRQIGRWAALDGLRGIAILMVLFNHFMPDLNYEGRHLLQWTSNLAQSGWAGVDLFFVLSGFLITGILLDAKGQPRGLFNFYVRRVLRIFPVYYLTLFVIFAILPMANAFSMAQCAVLESNQLWSWFYLTNLGFLFAPGGFYCELANVGHFWSLAIEEHYYVVWPALVTLTTPRQLKIACLCVITGTIVFRSAGQFLEMSNEFFKLTPGRIDGLAIGSLLAVWTAEGTLIRYRRMILLAGSASAGILASAFFRYRGLPAHAPLMHSVGFTILGIGSAALIVLAVTTTAASIWQRTLSHGALRFFGKYSYGLYVIHGAIAPALVIAFPINAFISMFGSVTFASLFCLLAKVAISLFLAMLSWHLFETHFIRLKQHFKNGAVPTIAAITARGANASIGIGAQ